jgi:hypothetical protein
MRVHEVDPNVDSSALLAGAQFVDAYSIAIEGGGLDARQAAEKMLARAPRWIEVLLVLRNFLVAPLGLRTSAPDERGARDIIGVFPVVRRPHSAHHRDHAGIDAQPAWPNLFGDHPAISPTRRPRHAAADRGLRAPPLDPA